MSHLVTGMVYCKEIKYKTKISCFALKVFFLSSLPRKSHSVSVLFQEVIASWVFENIHTKAWANV